MFTLTGLTNPESAELLGDGETIVFGNCTMVAGLPFFLDGLPMPVYVDGSAFVGRARITSVGVEMAQERLVSGLTSALGIDVLPKATAQFPAGTVFIATGGRPIVDKSRTQLISDPQVVRPQALGFDAQTGEVRGRIPLWAGSPLAAKFNFLDQPNGLAFDGEGNLYVTDIPNSNPVLGQPPPTPAAVYRIPFAALDRLAALDGAAAEGVQRILMPGSVNGVTAKYGAIFVVSCSRECPVGGGIYKLSAQDFAQGRLPPPIAQGLGILDGVGVTRRGTVLASNPITGDVHAFTSAGEHLLVGAAGANAVGMPADINVCYPTRLGGEPALLVPDISVGRGPGEGKIVGLDLTGL
jgi:hypothetical protein